MHLWDYPEGDKIKKDEKRYLERLLTYGLGGEKIDREMLLRNLTKLRIPEDTRAFFELLLWNKHF